LLSSALIVAMVLQFSACGTIMYPERKGQKDGQIDSTVAILDGIGLLFFIVPGVIAFAVDFSNGTIYLPGTQTSSFNEGNKLITVKFDNKLDLTQLEKIISSEVGIDIDLHSSDLQTQKIDKQEDIENYVYLERDQK
jgi:hypothetical protein